MSGEVRTRRARHGDIDQLAIVDPDTWSASRLMDIVRAIAAGECWISEAEGHIAAYAIMNENFFHQSFIHLLHVHVSKRRAGVATDLLVTLERVCRTPKLFVSTNQSNSPMRSFLAKLNYVEVGVVDGLDEGDPEVFYMKRMASPPSTDKASAA